jgi:L-fuconolactonase
MTRPITRRGFLQATAAAPLAAQAGAADSPAPYDGEIVDTHLHLWDLKVLRLPWVASATGHAKDVLAHDHGLADYAEATRGLKVTRAVYMEVDVAESDQVKEAEYVTKICEEGRSPMVAAVVSGRPASEKFGEYLDRFQGNRFIKGLRQVLHTPRRRPRSIAWSRPSSVVSGCSAIAA